MDLAFLPPLPVGMIPAAARAVACRASQFVAAAQLRRPGWPGAAVWATLVTAGLMNSMDWGWGAGGFIVSACLGSLVATAVLAAGWISEPEELERWALRAIVAALGSALPALGAT